MILDSRVSVAVLFCCIPLTEGYLFSQAQPKKQGSERVDSAGPFRLRAHMPPHEQKRTVSGMQEFAWSHWKNQWHGRLIEHYITVEGASIEISLYFEKDEEDVWRVRIERKEFRPDYEHRGHRVIVGRTQLAYTVQRLDQDRGTGGDHSALSDDEKRAPGTYVMEFKDKAGQTVLTLDPFNPIL